MVGMGAEHIAGVFEPQADSQVISWRRLAGCAISRTRERMLAKILIPNHFIHQHGSRLVRSAGLAGSPEMSDFKLQVEKLGETREVFQFEASGDWWIARESVVAGEFCEVEQPFVFDLEGARAGDNLVLEGCLHGRVLLECSRCAKRYPHVLRDEFRLVLEPAKGREPTDPEGMRGLAKSGVCLGEDLEAGWYRGPLIRLDDFFGEVIALTMPLQPLCREDCAGICSHCGVDLTETQCGCVDERIDSPFAVLAKLKGETEEN
jgi:uncharacterized protein